MIDANLRDMESAQIGGSPAQPFAAFNVGVIGDDYSCRQNELTSVNRGFALAAGHFASLTGDQIPLG